MTLTVENFIEQTTMWRLYWEQPFQENSKLY